MDNITCNCVVAIVGLEREKDRGMGSIRITECCRVPQLTL